MNLSDMYIIVVHINFLYTSQVLRVFTLILLWNQGIQHYLKICFHGRKHNKIIHLREQVRLTQVIIN